MSYKDDLKIDKYKLDDAWIRQASLFCDWAEKEVEAQYKRDKKKEQLDLKRAQLDAEIRKNPTKYGLEKITEMGISNAIAQHKDYLKVNEEYLDAVKEAKIMGVAREAFDHKKKALEKLTDLFLSRYWADPKEGRQTKEVRDEQGREQHLDALKEGMDNRVRRRRLS